MKQNNFPVPPITLSAMTEMRQWQTVEQLEKWKDAQPYSILFDNDFIVEYKKFYERLKSGRIDQPVKHMNPINREYHCSNCDKYGVPVVNQYDLHFCSTTCRDNYNWELGSQECDEERQRMSDDTYADRNYIG